MLRFETVEVGLSKLADICYFPIRETTAETWFEMLSDLPDVAVASAFSAIAKTFQPRFCGDRPTPAAIRSWVLDHVFGGWHQAFSECLEKAQQITSPVWRTCVNGQFEKVPVIWSSPLVEQAFKQFGGHQAFNSLETSHLNTARAQFRDLYNQIIQKAQGHDWTSGVIQIDAARSRNRQIAAADNHLIAEQVSNLAKKMGINS